MDINLFYLLSLLFFISVVMILFKRPVYEAMVLGLILITIETWRWDLLLPSIYKTATSPLFYIIIAFLTLSDFFSAARIVDKIIAFLLALVGRFTGGAGYVSLFGSTFMASLSGSGPGNVAATGVITIPAMIKTGFPAKLAATTEMASSSLGPVIFPSATIFLALDELAKFDPVRYSGVESKCLLAIWSLGIWFILQRFITILALCKIYKVKPVPKIQRPKIIEAFLNGWKTILLPFIIILPLVSGIILKNVLTERIGIHGYKALSTTLLFFCPVLAFFYAIMISRKEIGGITLKNVSRSLNGSLKKVVPVSATIFFAYTIGEFFRSLEMGFSISSWINSFQMSKTIIIFFIPLFTCFLGMLLPGTAQIKILGGILFTILSGYGYNSLFIAVLLPAITGALEGMTPPLALTMYVAMGISGSKFWETSKSAFLWILLHLFVVFLLLFGLLPVFGLY
jgi:TRAP-type C4-dicarboxylate transport system permease large subunit